MNKLIIGVDGGGTKSHLVIFGEGGNCLDRAVFGALNHECMKGSYDEFKIVFPEFVTSRLRKIGATPADVAYAVFGLAGIDTKWQSMMVTQIIYAMGFARFTLCNDGFLGVAAGCKNCAGISAINGTGSVLAGIGGDGAMVQIGGVHGITGDCGGSEWYGSKAVTAVYAALFKSAEPTVMTEMFFENLGITKKEDYVEAVAARFAANHADIHRFRQFVFDAAAKQDAVAMRILEASTRHYAGGIAHLAQELNFPHDEPLCVTFAGSVFIKEQTKILPRLIETRVRELLGARPVEFLYLDTAPVAGAAAWAARKAGFAIEMSVIKAAVDGL
ncbi:MAG: hypothetical protein FWH20_08420 [Oscillospiraceae bacterium]|nr:hypothetical protein [Oscillospiraceae bacterium]